MDRKPVLEDRPDGRQRRPVQVQLRHGEQAPREGADRRRVHLLDARGELLEVVAVLAEPLPVDTRVAAYVCRYENCDKDLRRRGPGCRIGRRACP